MAEKKEPTKRPVKKEVGVYEAWVNVLAEMPETLPQEEGYDYSYTPLPAILNKVRPVLFKYGFAIGQTWNYLENRKVVEIRTTIYHKTGVFRTYKSVLPLANIRKSNPAQVVGATITYGRRYQISAILGIATEEDTDAQDVSERPIEKPVEKPHEPKKSPKSNAGGKEKPEELKEKIIRLKKLLAEAVSKGWIDKTTYKRDLDVVKNISSVPGAIMFEKAIKRQMAKGQPKAAEKPVENPVEDLQAPPMPETPEDEQQTFDDVPEEIY